MNDNIRKLTLAAMFLAVGQVLPFITGQIPEIGRMLCPMHFPVLLCGFFCGWKYGLVVGIICPLLRSVLFGMPVMYPGAIAMAFELGTYGLVSALVFSKMKDTSVKSIYISLLSAMVVGRVVFGIAKMALLGFKGGSYAFPAFMADAFFNSIPGIILQLVLIPVLLKALSRYLAK